MPEIGRRGSPGGIGRATPRMPACSSDDCWRDSPARAAKRNAMRICDVILKKRNGGELTGAEIEAVVGGYCRGEVPDAQAAAWLMAVCFRGMTPRETADLTMTMVRSGEVLDLGSIPGARLDKHSTGGVGDKTTLILVPLWAAAGVPVAKMSGRSLGHTGGTADKLEAIPGFRVALTPTQVVDQVARVGAVMATQTADLAPADKKLYALRDLTATVDCIPLIAASVMSKKIASGADAILLDVKAGSGAFMKTVGEARELASAMVEIGARAGRRVIAAITDMDQPLGCAVGNAIEVREAIEALNGGGPVDLIELCVALGGLGLVLGGKAETAEAGESMIREMLSDGRGARKLAEIIEAQGGDPSVVDDPSSLALAPVSRPVLSERSGFVRGLDALRVARAAVKLGCGRGAAGAEPDLSAGIYLHRKIGDRVETGDLLAEIHSADEDAALRASGLLPDAFEIARGPARPGPLVHAVIP